MTRHSDAVAQAENFEHLSGEDRSAFYDFYDYNTFWEGRKYDHGADVIAVRHFLRKIGGGHRLIDVGGGLGRLAPYYTGDYDEVVMLDPSSVQLKRTERVIGETYPNMKFMRGIAQRIPVQDGSVDTILCVRVSHHLPELDPAFAEFHRALKPGGFLVFDTANKLHAKSRISAMLKGKSKELRSPEPIHVQEEEKGEYTPFVNHHPEVVRQQLEKAGFEVIEVRSSSNFRIPFLKKIIPTGVLLGLEHLLQRPLAHFWFGPSIFFFARKKK